MDDEDDTRTWKVKRFGQLLYGYIPGEKRGIDRSQGKGENQNHAIVYAFGSVIQTIDMNQENYYEEALKIAFLMVFDCRDAWRLCV